MSGVDDAWWKREGARSAPPVKVLCWHCDLRFNEDNVEILEIHEDDRGRDEVTFVCPGCGVKVLSHRFG
jgi:hypothetical protein